MTPSSIVKDLDPAVERIIMRCLQRDPDRRPASALAVAAALPGGDALADALAAGETPSPALIAAAGEKEALGVWPGLLMLTASVVGVLALRVDLLARVGRGTQPAGPGPCGPDRSRGPVGPNARIRGTAAGRRGSVSVQWGLSGLGTADAPHARSVGGAANGVSFAAAVLVPHQPRRHDAIRVLLRHAAIRP